MAVESKSVQTERERSGQADFDFLVGRWIVHHRRLKQALAGCQEWEEIEGPYENIPIWGGKANMDWLEADTKSWGRIEGLTLRLYHPGSQQWRLYWANAAKGILEQPMIGEFKDGRGEFFDHELFGDRAIFVRFVWSDITESSCRWEQAFSPDEGRTWETNWIAEFTRAQ